MAARSRSPARNTSWLLPKAQLHPGCKATLRGLSVTRNGDRVTVEAFIPDTGKWRVKMRSGILKDLAERFLLFESAALNPPVGWEAELARMQAASAKGAQAPAPEVKAPEPELPAVRPGIKVLIHDLKGAVELNGQSGILEEYIDASGRWRVKLESGESKDLKPDNLTTEESIRLRKEEAAAASRKDMQNKMTHEMMCEAAMLEADVGGDGKSKGSFEGQAGQSCGPGGRFVIMEKLGEGSFSTVFRCKDKMLEGKEYAVKFARPGTLTRKALEKEVHLVGHLYREVGTKDPEAVRCLVSLAFMEGFEDDGYFAASFELMKYNLKTALLKYGAGRGLPLLPTVRNFGRNIFLALRALGRVGLIHCDVKPENLLMSRDNQSVKLCDFGSTVSLGEIPRTDQAQPRHFRAPEVILGQEYGTPIDVWSAGVTMFKLATDQDLFPAETNNEMLHEMLKVVGKFPSGFATSGNFALNHFYATGEFLNARGDMALNSTNPRICTMARFDPPMRPMPFLLQEALKEPPKGITPERHAGCIRNLVDLLYFCLLPDPAARATPASAVDHQFFKKGA